MSAKPPQDLLEHIWTVFEHGGNFVPLAGCNPGSTGNAWEIRGAAPRQGIASENLPVWLASILRAPAYAPHVLAAAQAEERLNQEAEHLHNQLYGRADGSQDHFQPAMEHALRRRYREIDAGNRIRKKRPTRKINDLP